jgi:hypothetical protein
MNYMFNENDIKNILDHGLSLEQVERQISHFKRGFPFMKLVAPATAGDGIFILKDEEELRLLKLYESEGPAIDCVKMVPASGAASRMFSHLFSLRDDLRKTDAPAAAIIAEHHHKAAVVFFDHIREFAFYEELQKVVQHEGKSIEQCIAEHDYLPVLNALLGDKGLGYAYLPKGLLSFHHYGDHARKAVEEHLVEGALYCRAENDSVRVHFTLSPEHIIPFEKHMARVLPQYEKEYGVKYEITHSVQHPSTDMIAVDLQNQPFREADGSLLFRPGGHGALLQNLDELSADIVFIKNIDNVVHDAMKPDTVKYKKILGGLLIDLRTKIFEYLEMLDDANLSSAEFGQIREFCTKRLLTKLPAGFADFDDMEKVDFWYDKLNRPIRICGMVKNEGEPGGGPFWVEDTDGELSLQIVESSQVDMASEEQHKLFKGSTHFNPVDLVCSTVDYHGDHFPLGEFLDPETGFISTKTKDGKHLKAQELPGLWNGSMAHWITVFVEVPVTTFNPVKTVNDLLRKGHTK